MCSILYQHNLQLNLVPPPNSHRDLFKCKVLVLLVRQPLSGFVAEPNSDHRVCTMKDLLVHTESNSPEINTGATRNVTGNSKVQVQKQAGVDTGEPMGEGAKMESGGIVEGAARGQYRNKGEK